MSEPANGRGGGRPPRQVRTGIVQSVERINPTMIRVILGGPGLATFQAGEYTDHYVKLFFPLPGVAYPQPFDLGIIRQSMPRERWPRVRTYTVRRWDAERLELSIDVFYHGEVGLAGPWAARLRPGDVVHFAGPGGGYVPSSDVDTHLLIGDESALPAIAASLERLPPGARAIAFVEVAGPEAEQKVESPGEVSLHWLHRGSAPVGSQLVPAVAGPLFPPGVVQAFVHGEAGFVKELRALLLNERGVARERLSISGYWRLGDDEDSWDAVKRDWSAAVAAEQDESRRGH